MLLLHWSVTFFHVSRDLSKLILILLIEVPESVLLRNLFLELVGLVLKLVVKLLDDLVKLFDLFLAA